MTRRLSARLLSVFTLAFILSSPAQAGLNEAPKKIWIDADKKLDFAAIRELEKSNQAEWADASQENLGYRTGRVWVKLHFENPQSENSDWVLLYTFALMPSLDLYFERSDGATSHYKTGRLHSFATRPIDYYDLAFPMPLARGQSTDVYIALESNEIVSIPFKALSAEEFHARAIREYAAFGLYFGAVFLMILYNLFLFFSSRDEGYLHFIPFTLGMALLQLSRTGLAFQFLWPEWPLWNNASFVFLLGFTFLFMGLFTRNYLHSKRFAPKMSILLTLLMIASASLMVLALAQQTLVAARLSGLLAIAMPLTAVCISAICAFKGSWSAKYFLVSISVYLAGTLLYGLKDVFRLHLAFITDYDLEISGLMEFTLLALGMADRMTAIGNRQERARRKLELAERERDKREFAAALAAQVSHDIRSPLAALNVIEHDLSELPEEKRTLLRSAVNRIRDIANNLLAQNRTSAPVEASSPGKDRDQQRVEEPHSSELLLCLIDPLISEKRLQYKAFVDTEIILQISTYGLFAKVQLTEFRRMISNLLDNAVESLGEPAQGTVTVDVRHSKGQIQLRVSDTGEGIPAELIPKLGQRGESHGKAGGSGLGLYHAKTSAKRWGGSLEVTSVLGRGTDVVITLPQAECPRWFASRLSFVPGQPVVILDDDPSFHKVWDKCLRDLQAGGEKTTIYHFSSGTELASWVSGSSASGKALYLVDFELAGDRNSGLQLIETLHIAQQSVLVTSRFDEGRVRRECERLNIPILPKSMVELIPLIIESIKPLP